MGQRRSDKKPKLAAKSNHKHQPEKYPALNRQILRLAIPNILSNLSVPLLSSVDTALMGHLDNVAYLGAIAIGAVIFNFVYWGFGFLRMGTTGLTAQAYGDEDAPEVASILARTLLIAAGGGLLLILSQTLIANVSFALLQASPEVETYAHDYFDIRIFAAPATLSLYAFHGWFLGMQNARYPLFLTILVNIVNIAFNFLFVFGMQMKADGVAWGTVIAQYAGLVAAVGLYLHKYRGYSIRQPWRRVLEAGGLGRIFRINRDIFIRTLALIFTFSYFTAKSAEDSDEILAANSILLQLINLLAYGVDGFAFAAESLVGRFIGAGDSQKLRQTVRATMLWGMGLALALSAMFFFFGEGILHIFTDKQEIILLAMVYMTWVVIAPFTNSICFIWDGVFIGATAGAPMRNSMLFCTFAVFLPAHLLLKPALGNHSLWLALTLFMVARGVTLTLYAPKYIRVR